MSLSITAFLKLTDQKAKETPMIQAINKTEKAGSEKEKKTPTSNYSLEKVICDFISINVFSLIFTNFSNSAIKSHKKHKTK